MCVKQNMQNTWKAQIPSNTFIHYSHSKDMRIDQLDEKQKLRLEYIISRKAQIEKACREMTEKIFKYSKETDDLEDRYNNLICSQCGKIFVRNQRKEPDYVIYRTDADRDI